MANCLIKDSEYWTKLSQSGISEFKFYSFASQFVEKYGRFPNLDEIPNSNSSQHLSDTIHINKNSAAKIEDIIASTGVDTIEQANIALNDQYTDLEVELFPLNEKALVDIKQRPSQYQPRESFDFEVEENPNVGVVFNQTFDKLRNLYGINLIPITNKELASSKWKNIPDVKNVSAFVFQNEIYINTDLADIDAPIHEMTHILLGSIRFKNPELYFELIKLADQFPNFTKLATQYPNKTQQDIYEEVFVQEVSRYLSGIPSKLDELDVSIKHELHYNIKRLLDSVLMGKYSVKSVAESKLYNMSLKDLSKELQSMLLHPSNLGTLDDAHLHRILSNEKSDLMKKGDLREECQ